MESELLISPVVLLTQHWVIWWGAIQEVYTVIPCTSFKGKQRMPIFGIVMPAIAHSWSECSPTHPCMDQIGQQFSWELNSLSQLSLQEKSVGHSEWRARLMTEYIPTGNHIPYVLNLQSSDVPRNECDDDFILFRVIRGSGTAWSWFWIVLW